MKQLESDANGRLFSLREVAGWVGGKVQGDAERRISGAAPFENATADDITLAASPKYLKQLANSRAGALVVPQDFACDGPALVQAANPQAAFARILQRFYPQSRPAAAIHPTAVIGPDFACGEDVCIGPHVTIGSGVRLGSRVVLEAQVVLGDGVILGDDVWLAPRVTVLARCCIGSRVTIQSGSVIGSDGYGYAAEGAIYLKIPHRGIVQIDDDVEIGANNTIDRATFGKTWIQQGVKTDNLVHVAHNVVVGENTLLIAQAGISGSVVIGRHAIIGGQAGIVDHQEIGDNAIVGPQTGVGRKVDPGEVVFGSPHMPHRLFLKVSQLLTKLPEMHKRLLRLEKQTRTREAE